MSNWNEERAAHKAARRSPAPEKHAPASDLKRKRAEKPYAVYHSLHLPGLGGTLFKKRWHLWHKTATRDQAEAWVEKNCRHEASYRGDARWKPAGSERSTMAEHVEECRQRYRIVGPGESKPTNEELT